MTAITRALALFSLALAFPLACGGSSPTDLEERSDKTCETDLDCTEDDHSYCDGFQGCVACVLSDHCEDGQVCENNECFLPQACSSADDCTYEDRPVCNWILGECAECVINADCGENAVCDQGKCKSVTLCVNSLDCPEETVCDRELGYCVSCVSDGDCLETHTCVSHECIPRCTSDKTCTAAGELCNTEVGYCVECVEEEDCPDLYHCDQGTCSVDVCREGTSTCVEGLNSREVCSENGAETLLDSCAYGTTCVQLGDNASCVPWTCQPGTGTCSQDNTELLICDADGLGGTVSGNCSEAGGICENNSCTNVVCDASSIFCDGQTVYQCNALGTAFTSIQFCGASYHCDAEAQGCTLNTCVPNSQICDGNVLKTCNANGSGYHTEEVDCADQGQVCWNAACQPEVCDLSGNFCQFGDSYSCHDNGSRAQLYDNCNSVEYCADGVCFPFACTPNQPACSGEVAGTCNSLGSDVITDGGTDCAQADQSCWSGSCLATVCDPDDGYFCVGNARYNCLQNGTSSSLVSTCSASYYCDDAQGSATCRLKVCTPDTPACDGNTPTSCNALGSGYVPGGTACDSDEKCVGGTCLPLICTPNAYYCQSGNVQRCGADGTTSSLNDTCSANEFCQEGTSTCRPDTCTAGQPTCDGALVATCAADGSGPLEDGVACAEGKTCEAGACLDIFCTPGSEYCEGNNRRTCNGTGTGYSATTACSSTYYCAQETPTVTACRFDICNPASATCDGETLATCGADGGSYTTPGTDCSQTGMLCTGTGCASSITELVGGTTTSSATCSNYRLGNRYAFGSARTLTEIKQYLNITGTIQLTWVIYEVTGAAFSTTYTKVFEKLTTSTGLIYHSSGPINFDVVPGKHYVIGVRPSGACTAYYGGVSDKVYLPSSGWVYYREFESNSGALATSWTFTGSTLMYAQELTFE